MTILQQWNDFFCMFIRRNYFIEKSWFNKPYFVFARDIVVSILILFSFVFVQLNSVEKRNPQEKIQIHKIIPETFGAWRSETYDTKEYRDKWKSINELLIRTYYCIDKINIDFIVEYSSDFRRNFSFHFPENCHRASGNEIDFLKEFTVKLNNNKIFRAKYLYVKGMKKSQVERDHLVVYWIVIDQEHYHKTFFVKLDQLLSGLLNNSQRGMLVRIDFVDGLEYSARGIEKGEEIIKDFIKDLHERLDSKQRKIIFGKEYL